jgi:hypothetical protein
VRSEKLQGVNLEEDRMEEQITCLGPLKGILYQTLPDKVLNKKGAVFR